jgi:ribokinase
MNWRKTPITSGRLWNKTWKGNKKKRSLREIMPEIIVVGSINIDLVIQVPRFPLPGETISGSDLKLIPGGKGANQAVACARQEIRTGMVGKVGDDVFGIDLLKSLQENRIDTRGVKVQKNSSTGCALIPVASDGENSIILSPGANGKIWPEDVEAAEELIKEAKILLLQLEIPLETVLAAAQTAQKLGLEVILNPAPAADLPSELLGMVDYLIPNQTELELISGVSVQDLASTRRAANRLIEMGVKNLIVTLGEEGAFLANQDQNLLIPGYSVQPVDTTAAGDSFIGGFAASLIKNKSLPDAVDQANLCGALAATRPGAQPSIPTLEELEKFKKSGKIPL